MSFLPNLPLAPGVNFDQVEGALYRLQQLQQYSQTPSKSQFDGDEYDDCMSTSSYNSFSSSSFFDEDEDLDMDCEDSTQYCNEAPATASMHRTMSTPVLFAQPEYAKQLTAASTFSSGVGGMTKSESAVHLCMQDTNKKRPKSDATNSALLKKPDDFLKDLLQSAGISLEAVMALTSVKTEQEPFFLKMTPEDCEAYPEAAQATRRGDLAALRQILSKYGNDSERRKNPLQSCNRFGESIVHIACRRGYEEIMAFLTNEANVSIRVRDDYGRTPFHDAAWTSSPNFQLMKLILDNSPELLFVKDTRGHTPLSYVPQEQWRDWCAFLKSNCSVITKTCGELLRQ